MRIYPLAYAVGYNPVVTRLSISLSLIYCRQPTPKFGDAPKFASQAWPQARAEVLIAIGNSTLITKNSHSVDNSTRKNTKNSVNNSARWRFLRLCRVVVETNGKMGQMTHIENRRVLTGTAQSQQIELLFNSKKILSISCMPPKRAHRN